MEREELLIALMTALIRSDKASGNCRVIVEWAASIVDEMERVESERRNKARCLFLPWACHTCGTDLWHNRMLGQYRCLKCEKTWSEEALQQAMEEEDLVLTSKAKEG